MAAVSIKEGYNWVPIQREYQEDGYCGRVTLKPFAAFISAHVEYLIL